MPACAIDRLRGRDVQSGTITTNDERVVSKRAASTRGCRARRRRFRRRSGADRARSPARSGFSGVAPDA
jgi:hypothetical protein